MNLLLDNIIFSLQKAGGISVVWSEHLKRILVDPEFNATCIERQNNNIFRKNFELTADKICNNHSVIPIQFERYINPSSKDFKGIFHSSYYRYIKSPKVCNVTTVHDFTYEYFRNGLPKVIHNFQKSLAIRNSQRIICVSENTKKDVLKFYPKLDESLIKVIYNGVDKSFVPLIISDKEFVKELIPFSSGEYVLYVGERKSVYKNFDLVIRACKIVKQPLMIIGGGVLTKKENETLNKLLGVNNFKQLIGINNVDLNIIYNNAFCLLYPSLYEGFGIPILEAQGAGCPVITTNCSSIPEVAGKGAVLLDDISAHSIANVLNYLKSNSSIKQSLKEDAYKNVQHFSWDKCYNETSQLYKELYEEWF